MTYAVDILSSTGSLGSASTCSSSISRNTLLVVFRNDPSGWASAQGTESSSYFNTSLKSISLDREAIKRRPNKFLSALTVTSFSSTDLTFAFFDKLAKVFMFIFSIGSQKPTSLVLIRLLTNNFILASPRHWASISCSDISSGITTPVARFISGTSSLYASSSNGLDITVCRVCMTFLMSFSSLWTLTFDDSLCVLLVDSSKSIILLVAVVVAVLSCAVKNHFWRALGLCVIPIMPPLALLSRLMLCSRAMSVQTWLNDCEVDLLTVWFPLRNSL